MYGNGFEMNKHQKEGILPSVIKNDILKKTFSSYCSTHRHLSDTMMTKARLM